MKTRTYFAFRVAIWDAVGDNIIEHVAGMDDFEVAEATYRAAWHAGQGAAGIRVFVTPGKPSRCFLSKTSKLGVETCGPIEG